MSIPPLRKTRRRTRTYDLEDDNLADVLVGVGAAFDTKSDIGHGHEQSEIVGLVASLASKSDIGHGHEQSEIVGLIEALDAKADVGAFASIEQGALADSALQPGDSIPWTDITGAPTLFSGAYGDLTGIPSSFPPAAHTQAWSTITSTPTTLAGYGITDAQPLATVLTNTTAAFTTAQETKLAGIAAGATANASDSALRDRSTHTGTQTASTISNFSEAVDDRVAALVVPGSNISITYDDALGTLTFGASIVVPDGTYDGIIVSGTGANWNLNPATPVILTAEVQGDRLTVNGNAGTLRPIGWETAGSTRWLMRATATAESGSNAGSNLELRAYDDTGTSLGLAFSVRRSTQVVEFGKMPTMAGAPLGGPAAFPMRPAAGVYVANGINGGALGTVAQAANRVTIAPFIPSFDMTIDQVAISVSTGVAATNAKVVIYSSDVDNRPSTVLAESADISCATAATVTASLSVTFEAGKLYWIGVRASSTQTLRSLAAAALPVLSYTNAATPVIQGVLTKTETYGSAASAWTYASSQHSNLAMPLVLMRVA